METITLGFQLWLTHTVVAFVMAAPILFFGRKRAHWQWWEMAAFVIPFSVWYALMCSDLSRGKSLKNLGECVYISFAIPIAALIRVGVGGTIHQRAYAAALIGLLCAVGGGAFFLTPPLPE